MNTQLIWEIFDLATILTRNLSGDDLDHDQIGETLCELVHKGLDAYEEHTGEPLFPALIKAEDAL